MRGHIAASILGTAVIMSRARAQGVPDYDFQWTTVGALGNPAIEVPGTNFGRGRVDYIYRISRLEITTSQWMEFVNTFSTQSDSQAWFAAPVYWGADLDPTYSGPGNRWQLLPATDAAMRPVCGISWRDAARYCNWLCNGKASTQGAIANGAYDTSTFGGNFNTGYTDQATHNPGAQFWIPTVDEWLKAAHYDPNRFGPGLGGWWQNMGMQDTPLVAGLPPSMGGTGQTSAGFAFDPTSFPPDECNVPLGAYAAVQSPWGLWDTSGGMTEWNEDWYYTVPEHRFRAYKGTAAGSLAWLNGFPDELWWQGGEIPPIGPTSMSFRIASVAVPSPVAVAPLFGYALLRSRRRRGTDAVHDCARSRSSLCDHDQGGHRRSLLPVSDQRFHRHAARNGLQ